MPAPTLVAGAPCWIDLYSSDVEQAKKFYGTLLGWTAEAPAEEFGGYFVFTKDGKAVAGCMTNDGTEGNPDAWTVYLTTDDADRTVDVAAAHGGQVFVPPMDVAENGRMAMVADPGGALVGIWQPNRMNGFEVRNEIGTAAWFELHTHDYDGAVSFYREVFGWDAHTMSDTPEFRYTTLGQDGGELAGIMDDALDEQEAKPAAWAIYFEVESTDAALETVVELGGSVIEPAHDTPYGRLAVVADATDTRFRLLEANVPQ